MSIRRGSVTATLAALAALVLTSQLRAQLPPPPAPPIPPTTVPSTRPAGEFVTFTFPENVELRVLIAYTSERLGLQFLYDEAVAQQRVTIKQGATIPKDSLLSFLSLILQSKGFALADMEQAGWKQIVPATAMTNVARPATGPATAPAPAGVVTQVFVLQMVDASRMEQALKPFLTQPGGAAMGLAEQRLLVVTDYASNMPRMAELVRMLDQPTRDVVVEFVTLEHGDAQDLSAKVAQVMQGTINTSGVPNPMQLGTVEAGFDQRTNQVALIGPRERVAEAVRVVRKFDTPAGLVTRTYQFQFASPERVDKLMKQMLDPVTAKRTYQPAVDRDARLLVVNGTPEVHSRIEAMKQALDVSAGVSPIRFYKLSNVTAADVLETLLSIQGEEVGDRFDRDRDWGTAKGRANPLAGRRSRGGGYGNGSRGDAAPDRTFEADVPSGGGRRLGGVGGVGGGPGGSGSMSSMIGPGFPTTQPAPGPGGLVASTPLDRAGGAVDGDAGAPGGFATQDATVTADPNTNTIIVVADPDVQEVYAELIRQLDKRRPQVLIECQIVTLDTSRNFRLGVDVGAAGSSGSADYVMFSSFGVSRPVTDSTGAATGRLALVPGLEGFNGAVLSSDVADIVINALLNTGRARVVSAPRILVNDNATGTLLSTAEQPYTDTNIGDTVSTTSFGGYVEAGTSIELTPHISDADYLQLEYSVALNRFSGEGSNGIPPARQTSALASTVTIPDGSTIIIGGLNSSNFDKTVNAIPVLGQIPLLEVLFSSRSVNRSRTTLFVFIRPIILRDDRFGDLKYLSENDVRGAGLSPDDPVSEPMIMR